MAEFSKDSAFEGQQQEICRDFKRNVCNKGSSCKYFHPKRDIAEMYAQNSVCHDFQNQKGCTRTTCKFLHLTKSQEEYIREHGECPPDLPQEQMDALLGLPPSCNDFAKGLCNRGDRCKYRHVRDDLPPGGGKMGSRGGYRPDPYSRPPADDPYDRMEMRRRYREDMMEDEIMYLRAQVSRLKRQVADLSATNESLMDENARLRVDRSRASSSLDTLTQSGYGARMATTRIDYGLSREVAGLTQTRSAYPYTSGLKLESPSPSVSAVTYSTGLPY